MKLRHGLALAAVLLLLVVAIVSSAPAGGNRSVTDRTPRGYRAAFAYLEATGTSVAAWEAPLDALPTATTPRPDLPVGATLVIAWPLARPFAGAGDAASLLRWVRDGNRAVLLLDAANPRADHPFLLVEDSLDGLLTLDEPVAPWAWEEWRTWAADRRRASGPDGTVALEDPAWRLMCPADAEIVATGGDGTPRACRIRWGKGEVLLLADATVWQNDHLARGDNLALLVGLLGGRTVRFDEWHHDTIAVVSAVPPHVPALLAAHLGGLWLLALLALARRFGDPLPPAALVGPSMARALHALATLHRGGRHAAAAAAELYRLSRARSDRKGLDPDLLPAPPPHPSDERFAAWAARVAAIQRDQRF